LHGFAEVAMCLQFMTIRLPQKSHGLHSVTGHIYMDGAVGLRGRRPCRLRFLLVSAIVATLKCAAQLGPCARYAGS
jgi:hypothetical protein